MLVVNRFRAQQSSGDALAAAPGAGTPGSEALAGDALAEQLAAALDLLATKAGYVDGVVGRNVDDPSLWVLQTRWADVGSYRRALSAYDVKLHVVPLLSRALDEPSAYELLGEEGPAELNQSVPRGSH